MDCCSPRSSEKDHQTGKPSLRAPQNVLKCHDIVTKYLWVAETCLRSKAETETRGRDDIVSGEGGKCTAENKGRGRERGIWNVRNMGGRLLSPSWTQGQSLARSSTSLFSHILELLFPCHLQPKGVSKN